MTSTTTARERLLREQLLEFPAEMLLIRRFEEMVEERFRARERAGFLHVCERNRWSESTPQRQHQPISDLTQRAVAFAKASTDPRPEAALENVYAGRG